MTKAYAYDAFGVEKNPDDADLNPFRYCGEYFDQETGTIYLRARNYDPVVGRFTQEDVYWDTGNMIYGDDPLQLNEYTYAPDIQAIVQSGNLYAYAINNPAKYFDNTGYKAGDRFESADEAAKDWANNNFATSEYIYFEGASLIYFIKPTGGAGYYSYTDIVWGDPHTVSPLEAQKYVPKGAVVFAAIHSHVGAAYGDGTQFSAQDKKFATDRFWATYLVARDKSNKVTLRTYGDTHHGYRESIVSGNLSIRSLSDSEKRALIQKYKSKWNAHLRSCDLDLGCHHITWPRD